MLTLKSLQSLQVLVCVIVVIGACCSASFVSPAWGGPIHDAAKNGDTAEVTRLLDSKTKVNVTDADKRTALHIAAYAGKVDTVKLLLDKGANISVKDSNGWTPLHMACQSGNTEIVKLLLEKGADVNATGGSGDTPWLDAAVRGHDDAAKAVLTSKTDPAKLLSLFDQPKIIADTESAITKQEISSITVSTSAEEKKQIEESALEYIKNMKTVPIKILEALGTVGGPSAIETLVSAMQTLDTQYREVSAQSLLKLGWEPPDTKHKVLFLISLRKWDELEKMGPDATELLCKAMYDSAVRDSICDTLVKIGQPAVKALLDNLKGPLVPVRLASAEALTKIGWEPPDEESKALWLTAQSKWDEVEKMGATAVTALVSAQMTTDSAYTETSLKLLAKIDPLPTDVLVGLLKLPMPDRRMAVAKVLESAKWTPPDAVSNAWYLIAQRKWDDVAKLGPDAEKPLTDLMKDDNPGIRYKAAGILLSIGDKNVKVKAEEVQTKAIDEAQYGYHALIMQGDPDSVSVLISALNYSNSTFMAECYLNCGNSELESAAHDWATIHGYTVQSTSFPQEGPKWGDKKH